jgi:hypothetical protein
VFHRLATYSFVRFSHSVFALPFALAGALLAARHALTWPTIADRGGHGCGARRWGSTGSSTRVSMR